MSNKKNIRDDLASLLGAEQDDDARFALAEQLNRMLGERLNGQQEEPKKASAKPADEPPPKVVRDSFTMPEDDYALIQKTQDRAMDARFHVTKGEVLRAGLHALEALSDAQLINILRSVEKLKPGRRKGN